MSSLDITHFFRSLVMAVGNGQLCVTIKKSILIIIAILNRIADSYFMAELQAILE
jgi:hypothetical protein